MQPTHAKWEHVSPILESTERMPAANGLVDGHHLTNGEVNSTANGDDIALGTSQSQMSNGNTVFTEVPAVISRNFTVVDLHFDAPPISGIGYPGPDGSIEDPTSGSNGLSTVSQDLIDELPSDCRAAFEEARDTELRWKQQWAQEAYSGQRGCLKIGFNGYPV